MKTTEIQNTPNHNRIQARFLDPVFCAVFYTMVWGEVMPRRPHVAFEAKPDMFRDGKKVPDNFRPPIDVDLWGGGRETLVEIKPNLGDDFPGVIRQIRNNEANVVLIGKFTVSNLSFSQVQQMFPCRIILLDEVEAKQFILTQEALDALEKRWAGVEAEEARKEKEYREQEAKKLEAWKKAKEARESWDQ